MTLLYNVRCDIFRNIITEDIYGSAALTGTITIASFEPCRFDYYIPKVNIIGDMGIETEKSYSLFFRSTRQHPIPIREQDSIKIVFPNTHPEYNVRFRVRGVQDESLHPQDYNRITECTLVRWKESRGNTF